MKISVIMPIFNCEKYLTSAINSVFSAGVSDIEIIAIDDASTDSSAELLRSLAASDGRIKAAFNSGNLGVAATRNLALSLARGEFIAFCDADDLVPAGAYSALLRASNGVDLVIGAHADLDDSGNCINTGLAKGSQSSLFAAVFSVACLWTKLIRKSFIIDNALAFDPRMKIGEDVVFLAELTVRSPRYRLINRTVYYHCQHDRAVPSLNHIYTLSALSYHILCRRRLLEICRDVPDASGFVFRHFTPFITDMLDKFVGRDDREEAFLLFKEHILSYGEPEDKSLFLSMLGVPYDTFAEMTAAEYFRLKSLISPRERVYLEFRSGRIGFRFIVKYFIAWLKYKCERLKRIKKSNG